MWWFSTTVFTGLPDISAYVYCNIALSLHAFVLIPD